MGQSQTSNSQFSFETLRFFSSNCVHSEFASQESGIQVYKSNLVSMIVFWKLFSSRLFLDFLHQTDSVRVELNFLFVLEGQYIYQLREHIVLRIALE